jgi:hypothetical protein
MLLPKGTEKGDNQRQKLMNDPSFAARFKKSSDAIVIDAEVLASVKVLRSYLNPVFKKTSFTSTGMEYVNYEKLVTNEACNWGWALLHKACQMFLSVSPETAGIELFEYTEVCKACTGAIAHINKLITDATEDAMQKLAAGILMSGGTI